MQRFMQPAPWSFESQAIVDVEPLTTGRPDAAIDNRLKNFLDVSAARDFIGDWETGLETIPSDKERCDRLIRYALHDARLSECLRRVFCASVAILPIGK
jgi:hypothetical protein